MNNNRQAIINRLILLRSRNTQNGNIIKKLERQLRKIDQREMTA